MNLNLCDTRSKSVRSFLLTCTALCTWGVLWYVLGHRVLSPLYYHNCTSRLQFLGKDNNYLEKKKSLKLKEKVP